MIILEGFELVEVLESSIREGLVRYEFKKCGSDERIYIWKDCKNGTYEVEDDDVVIGEFNTVEEFIEIIKDL